MPASPVNPITPERRAAAEAQISEHHKIIDYDTREYPVEVLVQKYLDRLEEDDNDLFVPDYQRDHVWKPRQQSRFIESVLMGLPIPYLFVADVKGKEGRIEIVDGSQRIRTLAEFMCNRLELSDLEVLTELNGFKYEDLPPATRRRFGRHTLRMIELRKGIDEAVRRDIFARINTGGLKLEDMEVRWGTKDVPLFLNFIRKCAALPLFRKLAPLSADAIKRHEDQEFALRFFASLNGYQKFSRSVVDFMNDYLDSQKDFDAAKEQELQAEWDRMLAFVSTHFENGFSKKQGHSRTPRIRFEAIAVGSALALRIKPDLIPASMAWVESDKFKQLMRSDASNSRPKLEARIHFVRDHLLGTRP
jgi:Protein of unknown function DUF262